MEALEIIERFLDLQTRPREIIAKSTKLHHYGVYACHLHTLDRPMWVSDLLEESYKYRNFSRCQGKFEIHCTEFFAKDDIVMVDIGDDCLLELSQKVGDVVRPRVDKQIMKVLSNHGIGALVWSGREILVDHERIVPINSVHVPA
ncbi:hypothetical protein [Arhodomonas aquaeolei]|uniref:hypothetical protein n=1 Tax=Arhodomonas aquaeolei TaxID=2369 RepID=UPI0012EB99EA|nr:hypothetical protein [Arhodomonas aquaeolei]